MNTIEHYKRIIKEAEKGIKELETPKYDFSKWVGRCGKIVAIKGERYLKSMDGNIEFSNNNEYGYTDKLSYTETTIGELKVGDVFICKEDVENIEQEAFEIVIGINEEGVSITQFIGSAGGIECIEAHSFYSSKKDDEVIVINKY